MGRDDGQQGPDEDWNAGDPEDPEMLDGSWEDGSGGRGGLRWLLLLLLVPIVALVVSQLGPDQEPTASPTPTSSTSPARSGPSPGPGRSGGWTAGVGRPTGHRGPASVPSVRDLGHSLLGITGDWDLFARGDNVVVRIQPARGRVTTTTVPTLNSTGPVSFLATSAGALVRPLDSVPGYFVPDGKPARELTGALGNGGPVVPGPDPDHVWVEGNKGRSNVLRLVGTDGKQSGPDIPLPANAGGWIMPDGGGSPLVDTSGGVYDVTPDGLRRITTGTVEAVGPTGWLAVECDDRNRCSRVVIERSSGDRRTLPGAVDGSGGFFGSPGVIAPDGSAAVVEHPANDAPQLQLIDLESGRSHVLPNPPATQGPSGDVMAWSPDSRWLFVASGQGALLAVDPHQPERAVTLGIAIPGVAQLAVRPAGRGD